MPATIPPQPNTRSSPRPPMSGRRRNDLFVARHRGQLRHVLQQDAAALQIEDAVAAPGLKLAIDAFARGADEDAELLLRNMNLGAEIGRQRAEPARQPYRQRLQGGAV